MGQAICLDMVLVERGNMGNTRDQQQTCKVCGRPDKFDFHIPDAIWCSIVPEQYQTRVVCLYCFDEFAQATDTRYAAHLSELYFAGKRATFHFATKWAGDDCPNEAEQGEK